MGRRIATVVVWSIAGVALTAALIIGGFALAGTTLTQPATPIRVSSSLVPRPSASRAADADNATPGVGPTGVVQPTGVSPQASSADDTTRSANDVGSGEKEPAGDD